MTRAELKALYVEAAIRARIKPQRSEEDQWFKEFEYAQVRDLKTAIDAHFKGGNEWMPKEPALKPAVDQAARSRAIRASEDQELIRRQCVDCGKTTAGFNAPSDNRRRYCQAIPQRPHENGEICGGDMEIIHRSQAKDANPSRVRVGQ